MNLANGSIRESVLDISSFWLSYNSIIAFVSDHPFLSEHRLFFYRYVMFKYFHKIKQKIDYKRGYILLLLEKCGKWVKQSTNKTIENGIFTLNCSQDHIENSDFRTKTSLWLKSIHPLKVTYIWNDKNR